MAGYIGRRILLAIFTVWVISMLSFFVIELPEGDLVSKAIDQKMSGGIDGDVDPKLAQMWRSYFAIDRPIHIRYIEWLKPLLRGDMGMSLWNQNSDEFAQRRISEVIGERIQLTIILGVFTILMTWTLAIPVGIYSAVRQHSLGDYLFTFAGYTGLAVPDFLLGLVLMYFFYAVFDMSVGGLFSANYVDSQWDFARISDMLKHLWIPAIVLGTSGTAGLIRVLRNNLLDELNKPYTVTAIAKGVHPFKVIMKYPVRVAFNPLISTVGYLLPALISGSMIVSVVLSLPTLGPILLNAIEILDTRLAGFIVLIVGVLTVLGTLISDILLAVVDPRIKLMNK